MTEDEDERAYRRSFGTFLQTSQMKRIFLWASSWWHIKRKYVPVLKSIAQDSFGVRWVPDKSIFKTRKDHVVLCYVISCNAMLCSVPLLQRLFLQQQLFRSNVYTNEGLICFWRSEALLFLSINLPLPHPSTPPYLPPHVKGIMGRENGIPPICMGIGNRSISIELFIEAAVWNKD